MSPIKLTDSPETQVFRYVVTKEDEGATELRFFRGNDENLWNESVLLRYSDYKQGNNCAKVKGWDIMDTYAHMYLEDIYLMFMI